MNNLPSAGSRVMLKSGMHPVHPGEVLREEFLVPLGMSVNGLAKELHVPTPRLNDVVLECSGVTADTAMCLARYFDTSPQFWMNLQAEYDLRVEQIEKGKVMDKEVKPRQVA